MLKTKIASLVGTGALLLSIASPAFAETIEITGNGVGSVNNANVTQATTTTVSQNNSAQVSNNVSSNANSGGNSASFNTGGDVNVVAGPAKSSADVTTAVNANSAHVDPCCGASTGNVTISGNGVGSSNTAAVNASNTTVLGQNNTAGVGNNVASNANSGNNSAAFNTGGNITVASGLAQSSADVTTAANVNTAKVGGSATPLPGAMGPSATITGNGVGSVNGITLNLPSTVALTQANSASISNNVASNANSGGNSASFNTGGIVMVHAGPAMATVDVNNLANFNAADVSCGCILGGLTAKIAGNGASAGSPTFSSINANLAKVLALSQGNGAGIGNYVAGNAKSGDNSASLNTGAVADDPSVVSQGATSETNVSNLSNWNSAGTGATVGLPGGSSLNLLMDFSALLTLLSL